MPPAIEYPSVSDYVDALQHPRKCFRLPELQAGAPELDARRLPCPQTGGAAAVFRLDVAGASFALKVFKFELPHRQQRYQAISDHLRQVSSRYLVGFTYVADGIRVPRGAETFGQARWYPILRMPWVSGVLLKAWLEEQVTRRDGAAIRRFSERFEAMIAELKSHSIAHGDLQHGNVKVVNGEPVLVDYDGTFVPALAAQPAEEFGLPGYQHPQRRERQWWSADLDDFSAWVIWLSLRALAADLSLWHRLKVAQSETLLFAPEDLERPHESRLWPDLLRSSDRIVAQRAEMLRTSLSPPFAVPPFTFDSARRLRELCGAAVKDWAGIDREAAELKRAGVAIPPELRHDSNRACQLVEERRALEDAVRSGDPRRVVAVLRAELENDWPACTALVDEARRAGPQVRALAQLDAALTPPVDEPAFVALWKRHAPLLAGVAGAARYEFLAVAAEPPSEQAVVDAWKKLHAAGGHPSLASPHPRVLLAERRLPLLAAIAAVPRVISEDADRAFVRAYQPAVLADCAEAELLRRWYEQASERVRSLDRLHGLIAGGRDGLTADRYFEQVSSAAASLPANYPHARRKEAAQALEWLRCRNLLRNACAARQWEEAATLAKTDFAQQPLPEGLADEARKAAERVEARQRLDAALASGSLERAASACRPDLLDDWPECAGLVAKGRRAKALLPALKQMQAEAANPGDGRRLVQTWQAHAAELTPWTEAPPLRQAAESWRRRIEARDAFERLLNSPRPTAQALAESWQRLLDVGGHPDAIAWQPQGERASVCVACMAALRRVPAEPSESADRLFDGAWHQALDDWWEAEGWLPRLSVVRHRLSVLAELEEPLRRGDDLSIVQVAARLPPSYRFDQPARQARVAEARQRADVLLLLLKAYDERRWDDVARLAGSLQGMAWPDDLRARIEDATVRVRARQGLQTALHSASLEQTVAEYRPDCLDDWPECAGAVERARQATRLLPVLKQMQQEAADPGDGRGLVRTWQAHKEELQGWKEAAPLGLVVRAWEARLDGLAAVERLAAGEAVTSHRFVAAWNRLRDLGGHPDAERWRTLAVRMQRRSARFDALRQVPDEASESADRAFAAAWREDELSGWWEAEALRPRLASVRARLAILGDLASSLQDDQRVADLAARLPDGYVFGPELRDAVERRRLRVRLREQMRRALDERPGSDLTIAAVHADFVAAGLSLDESDAERCELAKRRSGTLLTMRHLSPEPIDQRDEAVLRLWQEGGLASCPDVTGRERQLFEEAALRAARAQQLRDAVETGDLTLVEELAGDPLLANYPPVEALRERIGRLLAERRKGQAVLDCVQRAVSDEEFARLDVDLSCVAEYPVFFRPYRAQLASLLRRELSRAKLRGGQLELSGVGATMKVTARWTNCTWRTFGLGEWACKLAVSDAPIPDSSDGVSASLVLASGYRAHRGARRDAPPGARRVYVTVWPVLQLDALKVEAAGAALHLAIDVQIPPRGGWRRLLDSILPRG